MRDAFSPDTCGLRPAETEQEQPHQGAVAETNRSVATGVHDAGAFVLLQMPAHRRRSRPAPPHADGTLEVFMTLHPESPAFADDLADEAHVLRNRRWHLPAAQLGSKHTHLVDIDLAPATHPIWEEYGCRLADRTLRGGTGVGGEALEPRLDGVLVVHS